MKKTLFLALALCCTMPVMAATEGQTLALTPGSGTSIPNYTDWSFYVTFDSLGTTGTAPVTLATVDIDPAGSDYYKALYAMGYTYGEDSSLSLNLATFANPTWATLDLGKYTVSSSSPLSVAFSHAADTNKITITAGYLGEGNKLVTLGTYTAVNADKYSNAHLSQVDLGTNATATNIYNKSSVTKLTPASTGESGFNIVSSRLNHEAYSDSHFEDFILEEAAWSDLGVVRYTAAHGNTYEAAHAYKFNTEGGGEVSFNPDKFDKNNTLTIASTTANPINPQIGTDTTFIVEDGKTVKFEGNMTGKLDGDKPVASGSITKTGNGTLITRINDISTDNETNKFYGDVHVEEGTLHLYNDDPTSAGSRIAYIGGVTESGDGKGATVRVEEGAKLILGEKTGICMPAGNGHGTADIATTIAGGSCTYGALHKEYENSWLTNVIVTETSITSAADEDTVKEANAKGERLGEIVTHSFSLVDTSSTYSTQVRDTTIYANEAHLTGHVTIDNSTISATDILVMTDLSNMAMSMKVQNHSQILLDNEHAETDASWGEPGKSLWGVLENVSVDATSLVNSTGNWREKTHIALMGNNSLEVSAKKEYAGFQGHGLADVTLSDGCGHPEHEHEKSETLTYVTTQLSGCYLLDADRTSPGADKDYDYANTSLNITLDDVLPGIDTHDHFTFLLVLEGLDSSEVLTNHILSHDDIEELEDGKFYDLGEDSPVHLTITQYMKDHGITMDGNIEIAHYNVYSDGHGAATAFKFTLERVPEPATATLSLLALAALASRRRRR